MGVRSGLRLRLTSGDPIAVIDRVLDSAEWDRVWRSRVESAFYDTDPINLLLDEFWTKAFSSCSSEAHILDIACGNGALARCLGNALEADAETINYVGVDKASINPPPDSAFGKLRPQFLPNLPVEGAAFGHSTFDLIVSQFGLEYSDKVKTIELASKWIKPGGRMVMVIHSSSSAITFESKQILEQLRVIKESAVIPLIYKLLERMENLSENGQTNDQEANFLRKKINVTLTDLESISNDLLESRFLEGTVALLLSLFAQKRSHIPASIRKENLEKLSLDLHHHQARLMQQTASAMGPRELESLAFTLRKNGFKNIRLSPLSIGDEEIGQAVESVF